VQFTCLHNWEVGKMTVLENDGRNRIAAPTLGHEWRANHHFITEETYSVNHGIWRQNIPRFIVMGRDGNSLRPLFSLRAKI
jgi:hypothetical protein